MGQGLLGWLQLLDLVAIQLGLALVLGSWASHRWLVGADSPWSASCSVWTNQAQSVGVALGIAGLVAAIWLQAAVMADVPLLRAAPAVVTLLRDTHYGHVALIGAAAWCAVTALAWRRNAGIALLLALLVAAWSRSAVSHAANSGDYSFDVAVDGFHVLATSLWVGMVLVAARLPTPLSAMPDRLDASRWVATLSSYATVALVLVVLTGLFKVYRAVPNWSLLPASDYGRTLFVKLALVGTAVLLGGYNRVKVLPGLHASLSQRDCFAYDPTWTRRLLAVLRVEMVVLILVVGWAALLASSEPPG